MAFDHDAFFTIVGKYVKLINTLDGYYATIETGKEEIRDQYELEDLHDIYGTLPSRVDSFYTNLNSWIQSLITHLNTLITDKDYVIRELPVYANTVQGILQGLHNYMTTNSETIESSIVTIGGVDADFGATPAVLQQDVAARLYCTRILDAVNAPGNGVPASILNLGVESQLARSCTTFYEILTSTENQETAKIFSDVPVAVAGYLEEDEDPGVGPTVSTAQANNYVTTNDEFDTWVGDNPTGWTMAGGVSGTDWEDYSSSGIGPLQINTTGVTGMQQVTGLSYNRMYFLGARFSVSGSNDTFDYVVGTRLRSSSGTTIITQKTGTITDDASGGHYIAAYGFGYVAETYDLEDTYFEFEFVSRSGGTKDIKMRQCVLTPAFYWNGLGWAWWKPETAGNYGVGYQNSVAIANDDSGLFQAFFRKAYNFQLPTADSPTILDTLAT